MRLLRKLRRIIRDERGNALAIGAAALPLLLGGAGMAVDTVQISLAKRQLQRSADSAAIAGAHAALQSFSASDAVNRDLAVNNDVPLDGAPVVQNAPTSGPYAGNPRAVRVQLTTQRSLSFLSVFTGGPTEITVSATAAGVVDGEFCMLALDDSATDPGVSLGGNTTVNIGCGISTNSRAPVAITAGGSSLITASPIMAVGGVPASSNFAPGTELVSYVAPQQDPFGALPLPAPSNCTGKLNVGPRQTRTISPGSDGTACYNGMDLKGNVSFAPGVYYINGSSLDFGSQANVSGTGVTFILTSTNATSDPSSIATMSSHGGATVNLSGPSSGPYEGVIFYQDPRAPLGQTQKFNGNSSSSLEGAFYFPRAHLEFSGTSGMQTRCMQLVARRLVFTGNSRIENSCPDEGGARAFQGTYVRLVS